MVEPAIQDDGRWTVSELAKWLRVSDRHLQRLMETSDAPPAIRLGRRIIFSRAAVTKWLEARTSRRTPRAASGRRRARRATAQRGRPDRRMVTRIRARRRES